MSTISVKVVGVEILEHPNADRLDIARIGGYGGYECVVTKGEFNTGDLVIFIPPDSVLPENILKYQQEHKKISIPGGRIRAVNIRGKLSEGLCLPPADWLEEKDIKENNDVTDILGITKYKPPPPSSRSIFRSGKGVSIHYNNPHFHKYTDIDNIKKHPKVLKESERVVATVKMHGTNFRCGWVKKQNYKKSLWRKVKDLASYLWNGYEKEIIIDEDAQEFLVGSHKKTRYAKKDAELDKDLYWRAAIKYNLKELAKNMAEMLHLHELDRLKKAFSNFEIDHIYKESPYDIIIYAEIIGPKIQKGYDYGIEEGDIEIRIFDIKYNGQYINWGDVQFLCLDNKLPCAHSIYEGEWYPDLVKEAEVVDEYNGRKFTREGIVIKPIKERWDEECGRVIFKALNPAYLLDKTNSENH
jgi:RNA ligase (TIGR02306 family)